MTASWWGYHSKAEVRTAEHRRTTSPRPAKSVGSSACVIGAILTDITTLKLCNQDLLFAVSRC